MKTFELRNEETAILDLKDSPGISATNVSDEDAKFYVDYLSGHEHWSPVTGEKIIKPGGTFDITKPQIGHDVVRVGARGKHNGTIIIRGRY
ncbi:hypothetical protein [Paraflavitalea speifideaquila]|uniref:hypothetical protein n=1 Tax=Paraflavitalea speifideaquila TaxID=3076558 RepID=UPI0028E3CA99|nr:hypothetical protein [Paraflavitalea speifideiaquila]